MKIMILEQLIETKNIDIKSTQNFLTDGIYTFHLLCFNKLLSNFKKKIQPGMLKFKHLGVGRVNQIEG